MKSDSATDRINHDRPPGTGRRIVALLLLIACFSSPASAGRWNRGHPDACGGILEAVSISGEDGSETVVTLDDIVPENLQTMIRTDRASLTGVWISDLDLWTPANTRACEAAKAGDCPEGALEGACPERPPEENAYNCGSVSTWANNTFALYELTTGSLYALNLWRVWSQQDYPTLRSLRAARPAVDYGGFSFQNGVRNLDDRVYMMTSMGEVETVGTGGRAPYVQIGDQISMDGRVYDSNVGSVIVMESRTSIAASLVYSPTTPNQAVWKVNLRRVRKCVTPETFEDQVFPPRRPIRIER
ncbi:MAG: hypothetical protein AAEJ53_15995 [Myxococcota bacterium]